MIDIIYLLSCISIHNLYTYTDAYTWSLRGKLLSPGTGPSAWRRLPTTCSAPCGATRRRRCAPWARLSETWALGRLPLGGTRRLPSTTRREAARSGAPCSCVLHIEGLKKWPYHHSFGVYVLATAVLGAFGCSGGVKTSFRRCWMNAKGSIQLWSTCMLYGPLKELPYHEYFGIGSIPVFAFPFKLRVAPKENYLKPQKYPKKLSLSPKRMAHGHHFRYFGGPGADAGLLLRDLN